MAGRSFGRVAITGFVLLWALFAFAFLGSQRGWYDNPVNKFNQQLESWTGSTWPADADKADTPDIPHRPTGPDSGAHSNADVPTSGLEQSLHEQEFEQDEEPEKYAPLPVTKPAERPAQGKEGTSGSQLPISYQLDIPPKTGCEDVVQSLQLRLITEYRKLLKGVRYANIWGYLETENKGDAAIWAAQQILFSMMGIKFENACRFMSRGCDLERFNATLRNHKPYSAIVMAGGGNFNDHYWEDQPSRMEMIDNYHDIPIRAFPQSIHMTDGFRVEETKTSFGAHPNLQVAARDQPSYDWLEENFNREALGGKKGPKNVLVPDIAFMWGNRPDFRIDTNKTHDILILARDDAEISAGAGAEMVPSGTGLIDLGGKIGNVTYQKIDWKFTHTPGIDKELPEYLVDHLQGVSENTYGAKTAGRDKHRTSPADEGRKQQEHTEQHTQQEDNSDQSDGKVPAADKDHTSAKAKPKPKPKTKKSLSKRGFSTPSIPEFVENAEQGRNQRAWAKAIAGFELLGSARFVITDRLHGHILSTIIGVPHVLLDSKLGKNLNFHDTWTRDCECTRIAPDFETGLDVAKRYFEGELEGRGS